MLLLLSACTVQNIYPTTTIIYDVGSPDTETVPGDNTDTGDENLDAGAPNTTVDNGNLAVDVFGTDGNEYWLSVGSDQLADANLNWQNSWAYGGYYYSIGDSDTYANDLVVVDVTSGDAASFGKVQFSVVGQSTGATWDANSIPDISVDTDEYQDDLTVNGVEHLRFNNGQVSSIFRESIALEVFRNWGYPAPRTSFAWLSSNVWGEGVHVPYTVVERYRDQWCTDHADQLGGGCANAWEGWGDFSKNYGWGYSIAEQCEGKTCGNTRMDEFVDLLDVTPMGDGFEAATADYLDWPMIQEHMCADWILWIGDDPFHNSNNLYVVQGLDDKFRFLPYSTDISGGQTWYQNTSLYPGTSQIAMGCAYDAACWEETINTCQVMIDEFQAMQPANIVTNTYERLAAQGMLRDGDDATYAELLDWYTTRSTEGTLESELDTYREAWTVGGCADTGMVVMGGGGFDTGNPCAIVDTGIGNDTAAPPADDTATADTGA